MVKIKNQILKNPSNKLRRTGIILGSAFLMSSFFSCSSGTEYDEAEVLTPTQGIITEVKEVEAERFRITDEITVATKDDSRIIAEYLDGQRDTFTLEEARLVDASDTRRSGIGNVAMMGMMGYMMGRSMSTPTNRNAYANDAAYKKGQKTNSSLRSSASRKTVRTPKKGFGSSKSSKSYGG